MDYSQREFLTTMLSRWVETHPRPRAITLAFAGRTYTADEILEEVRSETEFGESLGNFLYESGVPIEELIGRAIDANIRGNG